MNSWKVSLVLQNLSYKVSFWLNYPLGDFQLKENAVEAIENPSRPMLKHANYLSDTFSYDILRLP